MRYWPKTKEKIWIKTFSLNKTKKTHIKKTAGYAIKVNLTLSLSHCFHVAQFWHYPEPGRGSAEATICWAGAELLGTEEAVKKQHAPNPATTGQPSAAKSQADSQYYWPQWFVL